MLFSSLGGWKELATTFDPLRYAQTLRALDRAGITYRTSTINTGNGNRRSGMLGALGEGAQYQTQYCVYVRKSDQELAHHVCQKEWASTEG